MIAKLPAAKVFIFAGSTFGPRPTSIVPDITVTRSASPWECGAKAKPAGSFNRIV